MQDDILWDNSESAMKMLPLQNMTVSQKKIGGAFWLNKESSKKDYFKENFKFPVYFTYFYYISFEIHY
jgi:hypothetical protein